MSRPSYQQLETLADFLMQNPGIAKGLLRTSHAKQETKRKWDEIATSLNALGGAQKDGKGWAKYWADKKCALKKTCAQQAQSRRRTGGGPGDNLPGLNPLDQRFVAVMGGPQFAIGDRHLAVNPFPSTSQNIVQDMVIETDEVVTPEAVGHVLELPASPEENVVTLGDTTPTIPTNTPQPQPNQRQPRTTRSRVLDRQQQIFADIERQRVEAETVTAATFANLVVQISTFQRSMDDMAAAIRESGQMIESALNNVGSALNNIASALQDRQ